ncbi:hypothetical protein GCM10022267_90030 [Lentzea roselyniae]|uniref:Integrase catalytic domain-containing protein n=1 Tax=Lentzea roselyniae TaxID=531940 RepID=A0ABP7CI78_9PSEU
MLTAAGVKIAPSTCYAARSRPLSARAVRDAVVTEKIKEVHETNYGVYGVRKIYAELARQGGVTGLPVARCTVACLMKAAGLQGISRLKTPRTTRSGKGGDPRSDLVKREFAAPAPNRLWVADITYIRTFSGWVYAAFVLDVFSRRVVGWQLSTSLRTDLALDALEMGLWTRSRAGQDTSDLIHHSDSGTQYLAVRYTPSVWPRPARSHPLAAKEIPTTTPWPRRSTRSSKPNSSATKDPGAAPTTSRSPSPRTSTGTTTAGYTANSA